MEVSWYLVVSAVGNRLVWCHPLKSPGSSATAGEDDTLHSGQSGGLVNVVDTDDIGGEMSLNVVAV